MLYAVTGYLVTARFSGEKLFGLKCMFCVPLQLLSETFFIVRRIKRDMILSVRRSSCKVPAFLFYTVMKLEFSGRILENTPISHFMKIRSVGAELFHAGGRTDMTKLSFFEIFRTPIKMTVYLEVSDLISR